jgi:UDP-N-acetylglucosamine 2-epimerase (non-hydrolysing)
MADLHSWFKKTIGFEVDAKKFILITGHRRENFGGGLQEICNALSELSFKYPEIEFIYPVHPNPNIQEPVYRILGGAHNVKLIAPLEYINFVFVLSKCYFVLTDSGGVQEEAPSLGKPVLVMRNHTERSEGIDSGIMRIVGTNSAAIVEAASSLLNDDCEFTSMVGGINPYGDGTASIQIINVLRGI